MEIMLTKSKGNVNRSCWAQIMLYKKEEVPELPCFQSQRLLEASCSHLFYSFILSCNKDPFHSLVSCFRRTWNGLFYDYLTKFCKHLSKMPSRNFILNPTLCILLSRKLNVLVDLCDSHFQKVSQIWWVCGLQAEQSLTFLVRIRVRLRVHTSQNEQHFLDQGWATPGIKRQCSATFSCVSTSTHLTQIVRSIAGLQRT